MITLQICAGGSTHTLPQFTCVKGLDSGVLSQAKQGHSIPRSMCYTERMSNYLFTFFSCSSLTSWCVLFPVHFFHPHPLRYWISCWTGRVKLTSPRLWVPSTPASQQQAANAAHPNMLLPATVEWVGPRGASQNMRPHLHLRRLWWPLLQALPPL